MLAALLGGAVPGLCPAQQTLVVDPVHGPYFDLAPAIAAASPGDTLLVSPGAYGSAVVSIGIQIVFAPGGVNMFTFEVRDVPAGQSVVVTGLELLLFSPHILLANNDGHVHLEDVDAHDGMSILNCAQVSLHDVHVSGIGGTAASQLATLRIVDSEVLLTGCSVTPTTVLLPVFGAAMTGSHVTLVESDIHGNHVFVSPTPAPAVVLDATVATITGDAATEITTGVATLPAAAIELQNGASLRLDPDVTLASNGGAPAIVGGTATLVDVPYLRADYQSPPQVTIELVASLGAFGVVWADYPQPPVTVAGFPDDRVWLGANGFLVAPMLMFVGDVMTLVESQLPLPPGTDVVLQGAVVTPAGGVALSAPLVLTLD